MLNRIVLMGRLTRDPELRKTQSDTPVCSFSLAVDRDHKKDGEKKETDFIDIVAWRATAEFVSKFFTKGRMAVVEGRLHLLDLTERCNGLAGRVIAHNGDAVVGAAYAVVEVPFATQVGTPVGEKLRILPLYLFPYRLPLCRGIVQGDLHPYLLLAGIGIQHMAFAVEWELLVLHLPASPSLPRRDAEPAFPFVYLHLVKTRLFQIRL